MYCIAHHLQALDNQLRNPLQGKGLRKRKRLLFDVKVGVISGGTNRLAILRH